MENTLGLKQCRVTPAYIESTDYVCHGTVFLFYQLQKMSSPEPSEVGQINTFWHFHLKMAKICN